MRYRETAPRLPAKWLALALAPLALAAADYHVGPGQAYSSIGDVPWYGLQAGDTVYIHYRSTPYHEKFLISGQGTPSKWIRVLGVPGPSGERPVISGDGATTSSNNRFRWQDPQLVQWDGVIQIAVKEDNPDGSGSPLPAYIEVAGLQVQDAYSDYHFSAENGATTTYDSFAACIYARSVRHILIRDNVMTNCGQGFYNWTGNGSEGGDNWWDGVAADITLRGNYFYNNGNPGSYTEHQTYTEADGVTIEYNHYGPQRAGALGSQLKDRSAGTVIRYNYIEQSLAGWDVDLVEPQEGYDAFGHKPTYSQAFVYGNIVVNKGNYSPNFFHWNEDHQQTQGRADLASGRLFFYDNTVVTVADRSDMENFSLFNVTWGGYECHGPTPGVIDVRNNIFAVLPRTAGAAIPVQQFGYCGLENFQFGSNWVSPGWSTNAASATGTSGIVSPAGNDPGFTSLSTNDFHLTPSSSAAGMAGPLAPEVTSNTLGLDLSPVLQYVYHQQIASRPGGGGIGSSAGALDLLASNSSATVWVGTLPAGLQVIVDGATFTERSILWSAGAAHRLDVVSPQLLDGQTYVFSGWSDGGSQSHAVTAPTSSRTYTATFTPLSDPPGAPSLLGPADAASGLSTSTVLTWTPSPGARLYEVHYGTSPNPPLAGVTTRTRFAPPPQEAGMTYYWYVVARNRAGRTPSSTRSFRTAN